VKNTGKENRLGAKINELRKERGWTQADLAQRTGIARGYIAEMETRRLGRNPSAKKLLALAKAFAIKPDILFEAAGYPLQEKPQPQRRETLKDLAKRFMAALPLEVPIYKWDSFPQSELHTIEPMEYFPIQRTRPAPNLKGYRVKGDHLVYDIKENDIVIVDSDQSKCANGNVVMALINKEICVAKYLDNDNGVRLSNNNSDYSITESVRYYPIVYLIRKYV
jgi:putative transcriptional regulator